MLCIVWMLSGMFEPETDKERRRSLANIPHAYMSENGAAPVIINGVRHVPWQDDKGEMLWEAYICQKRKCRKLFPAVLPARDEQYDDTSRIHCPHCHSTDAKRYYPEDSEDAVKKLLHP